MGRLELYCAIHSIEVFYEEQIKHLKKELREKKLSVYNEYVYKNKKYNINQKIEINGIKLTIQAIYQKKGYIYYKCISCVDKSIYELNDLGTLKKIIK